MAKLWGRKAGSRVSARIPLIPSIRRRSSHPLLMLAPLQEPLKPPETSKPKSLEPLLWTHHPITPGPDTWPSRQTHRSSIQAWVRSIMTQSSRMSKEGSLPRLTSSWVNHRSSMVPQIKELSTLSARMQPALILGRRQWTRTEGLTLLRVTAVSKPNQGSLTSRLSPIKARPTTPRLRPWSTTWEWNTSSLVKK